MNKLLKIAFFSLVIALALSVFAVGAEYNVTNESELYSAYNAINSSSEDAIINMGGDLTGSSTSLKFTTADGATSTKTVTINITSDTKLDDSLLALGKVHIIVNLNGFTFTSTRTSGSVEGSAFGTNSNTAKITVIGADKDGNFGKIISADVTYYVKYGTAEHFNADIHTKNEETFWNGEKNGIAVIKVDGAAITCDNSKIIEVNNLSIGSYFKNCEFTQAKTKQIVFDSYASDKGWELLFENVKFNGHTISSGTGKCAIVIKDPVDEITVDKITLGNDTGGAQKLYIITSPTCQKTGTQVYKQQNSSEVITTELETVPHDLSGALTGVKYLNGFANLGSYEHKCVMCDGSYTLDTATAPAIFDVIGYSSNPDGTGFGAGFMVNKSALNTYETLNKTKITFGCVVFNPKYLGEDAFFNGETLNVAKGSIQVPVDTQYAVTSVLIEGFNAETASLELVFAGYAYEGDDVQNIDIMQKSYLETEANPMNSKVTRGDKTLYTVTLTTICEPKITAKKEGLDEYVIPQV